MPQPTRILLKTTIPTTEDDWHIGRFSLLADHLASRRNPDGDPLHVVTARDRIVNAEGNDVDLAALPNNAYDQLWLIATDVTNALTPSDVKAIAAFRSTGGGVFLTRDHQDLGACLSRLDDIGVTQRFQSVNPENDEARRCCDDLDTPTITWPNYHSGANGDLQTITAVEPIHPILRQRDGSTIEKLPAHPHEGTVDAPAALADAAKVIALGRSKRSGLTFNLCVAIDAPGVGRAVSDSSFHHFANYNWNPRMGCPSFVTETPGDEVLRDKNALVGVHAYVDNIADWLARKI